MLRVADCAADCVQLALSQEADLESVGRGL
jgi:hypothetical protein